MSYLSRRHRILQRPLDLAAQTIWPLKASRPEGQDGATMQDPHRAQLVALEKAKTDKAARGEFETAASVLEKDLMSSLPGSASSLALG